MRSTFTTVFDMVAQMYQDRGEDEVMITPYQLALQIIDWADPQKCADNAANKDSHADLAVDILAALYEPTRKGEHDRDLCQSLSQLHFTPETEDRSLVKLNLLLANVQDMESISADTTALKAVEKFKTKLRKDFGKRIDEIDVQALLDDDLVRLYEVVGLEAPERVAQPEASAAEDDAQEEGQKADDDAEDASQVDEAEKAEAGDADDEPEDTEDKMEEDAAEERSQTPTPTSLRATRSTVAEVPDDREDRDTTPSSPRATSNTSKRLRSPGANKVMPAPAATKRARKTAPRTAKAPANLPTRKSTRAPRKGKASAPAEDAESGDDPFV